MLLFDLYGLFHMNYTGMNESVARMSGVDSEFSDGDGGEKIFALIFYLFISEINIVYCVNNSDFESG